MFGFTQKTRRRLTAAVAAIAMVGATVSTAAPSRAADADDIARALAAIAALAIIADALNDGRPTYRPPYAPPYVPPYRPPYHPPYYPPYHPPTPKPPVYGKKVLPDACRLAVLDRTDRRDVVYLASCLRRSGLNNLPSRCETSVRLNGGTTHVYRDNCLYQYGFRRERG